ncbi:MAG: CRISPR-associated protein Cas4 [bacterium]
MNYSEDDLLPISALQHLLFCERQCALIHIEQAWEENRFTVEGHILHEHVHEREDESRGDVRISRGLRLRSLRLGLTGVADVVEFHRGQAEPFYSESTSISTEWVPFPVEYKRGKPKSNQCDEVQLCAQAICLEEMMNVRIPAGALFYGTPRRRTDVPLDDDLRRTTEQAADRLHRLLDTGTTPPALYEKKCDTCSLLHLCMPETAGRGKSAVHYLARMLQSS